MKKICLVLLIVSFQLAFLAGCGKKSDAAVSSGDPNAPVAISVWIPMQASEKTDWFTPDAPGFKVIREKTGVTVNWQVIPGGSPQLINEAYNLLMASGDIPDVVIGEISLQLRRYPQAWLSIDELIKANPDRYPNLTKYILEDEYLKSYLPDTDGHIRYVPMLATRRIGDIIIARDDLLQKYGLAPPVSADDWHTALVAAKKDGKVGFMSRQQRAGILYRLLGGYVDCVIEDYFVEDGKVKYGVLDPRFKEGIELARQWYAEGLIDPEYPTTDSTRWWESVLRGNVFATHDNIQRIQAGVNDFVNNQHSDARLIGVGPMLSPRTGERHTVIHYPHVRDRSAAISVSAKNPERILDYFEYCFSEEGFILMNFGIEGYSFNYVDGVPKSDPDFLGKAERGEVAHPLTTRDMPKNQRDELIYDYTYDREDHKAVRDARDLYTDNDFIRENWIASLSFTEEERATLSPLRAELDTYRGEWLDKFIMGIEPMSKWDAFVSQIQKMNLQTTLDIYQKALDRLLKK
ncbi:MAG: extracellular solute-binding protein [Spirochaetaceae bacterium]|jgi:putative aldouronate transport system substrate-binding protein|nr:extracellular solute-binding protein [Spirochaetaceae bacterium]